MTGPAAKLLRHSVSPEGIELKSFEVTLHRFVLAELNTHREFSRNFRSSRAVPTKNLIHEVRTAPAMPVYWGRNRPGMQADEELTGNDLIEARVHWEDSARSAAARAEFMLGLNMHKQLVNRVLEPYLYVHGVVSSTNYANFYALRRHKDAQPEIKALADAMWEAEQGSKPTELKPGQWHLPYVPWWEMCELIVEAGLRKAWNDPDIPNYTEEEWHLLRRISAARCARVSYKPFDADRRSNFAEDLLLFDKLVGSQPMHASPTEHQATPDAVKWNVVHDHSYWEAKHQHGNFSGWIQHRKTLPGEYISTYAP
jgi:hypothetical protein